MSISFSDDSFFSDSAKELTEQFNFSSTILNELSKVSPQDRQDWLKMNMNLDALSYDPIYPTDSLELLHIGLPGASLNAGKPIPDDKPMHKARAREYFSSEIQSYLNELISLDASFSDEALKIIDNNVENWKKSKNGLMDVYNFLKETIPSLRKQAIHKNLLSSNKHHYLETFNRSQRFKREINTILAQYQKAKESEKKSMAIQMRQIIKIFLDQKNDIPDNIAATMQARENLELLLSQKQKNVEKLIEANNKSSLEEFEKISFEHEEKIKAAMQKYKRTQKYQCISELKRELFSPSQAMIDFLEQSAHLNESMDTPCSHTEEKKMNINSLTEASNKHLDIRFFDIDELQRLARFFNVEKNEFNFNNKDGIFKLTERINSVLDKSPMSFNDIVDIAAGKTSRKEGTFSPLLPNRVFFDNIAIDEEVMPNYEEYIERRKIHSNKKINEKHGINIIETFNPQTKHYEYVRELDASYLYLDQFTNLGKFFSRTPDELFDENEVVDQTAVIKRINEILNTTSLTFKDIIDVATGYKSRKENSFAPQNDFEVMLTDDICTRDEACPNYQVIVQTQREQMAEAKLVKEVLFNEENPIKFEGKIDSFSSEEHAELNSEPQKSESAPPVIKENLLGIPTENLLQILEKNNRWMQLTADDQFVARIREATYLAADFLHNPHAADMAKLLNSSITENGSTEKEEVENSKENEKEIEIMQDLTKLKNLAKLLSDPYSPFLTPCRKSRLKIFMGFLHELNDKYKVDDPTHQSKISALCCRLLNLIQNTTAATIDADEFNILMSPQECKNAYARFKARRVYA